MEGRRERERQKRKEGTREGRREGEEGVRREQERGGVLGPIPALVNLMHIYIIKYLYICMYIL